MCTIAIFLRIIILHALRYTYIFVELIILYKYIDIYIYINYSHGSLRIKKAIIIFYIFTLTICMYILYIMLNCTQPYLSTTRVDICFFFLFIFFYEYLTPIRRLSWIFFSFKKQKKRKRVFSFFILELIRHEDVDRD